MRTRLLVFASVAAWVLALGWMAAAPDDRREREAKEKREIEEHHITEAARIEQGFDIAPVHLNLHRKDRALVGLGSYLVNAVGGCNDCHTNPPYKFGGDPALGQPKQINTEHYLAGGTKFGPFFTSRNLTPEDVVIWHRHHSLPEGHTFAEFKDIIRHGTDFDMEHPQFGPLLQVMPWPVYQSMIDHDLRAIYEYLSSIPSAEPCASVSVGPNPTDPFCATLF